MEPDGADSGKKRPRLAETNQEADATEPATATGPLTKGRGNGGRGGKKKRGNGRAKQTPSKPVEARLTRSSVPKCECLFLYPKHLGGCQSLRLVRTADSGAKTHGFGQWEAPSQADFYTPPTIPNQLPLVSTSTLPTILQYYNTIA